jgi:PAS domain S-box-containing protein
MVGAKQQPGSGDLSHLRDRAGEVWSEGALRLVFEKSPDATVIIQDGLFIDCNPAAVQMFRAGWRDQLLFLSLSQVSPFVQPDGTSSAIKAKEMIAAALEQGNNRFEWLARRQDNSEFAVEILLTAVPFKDKQLLHTVWRDISRRKEVERELSQAREKDDAFRAGQGRILEMIARGAKLPEVLARLVNLIEAQSDGMICSVLQLSEDGKRIRSGAAPNLPEIYVKAVNGAPIGPKNGSCGTAMFRGQPVVVTDMLEDPLWEDYRELAKLSGLRACWSTPIFSGAGKVLGSFAMYYRQPQAPTGSEARLTQVATHIAGIAIEHERSENELRASEERFAKAFNANPYPMSLARLDDGRVIEVNESLIELSGYSRPELIERGLVEFLWEMALSRPELIERVRKQGVVRNLDARIRTRGGRLRLVLLSSLIVDIGGLRCLLSVANDITEWKRAEEQLRDTRAELAHVARLTTMGELAASIAHEVNQPLGAIVGNADICLRWLKQEPVDLAMLREALEDIAGDGHRASQVISRIRSLAKKQVPEKAPVDLSDIAREVLALLSHEAQRKQVELRSELKSPLPSVAADRVQLQQVLLNLVMNGIEAMSEIEDGRRELKIETEGSAESVLVTVSDSGPGLDAAQAEQIFKPFHTTKSDGMGMGLAISRSIIESSGGKLWAESNQRGGATFKFALPVTVGETDGGIKPGERNTTPGKVPQE